MEGVLTPDAPWRQLARIAMSGLMCAFGVAVAGLLLQTIWLGRTTEQSRRRVEADVRSSFDEMARSLQAIARLLSNPENVLAASQGEASAARLLFDTAERALQGGPDELAVTVYSADGRPIAWAGRPSELSIDHMQEGDAWFLSQATLGLRLVYLTPLTTGSDARRIGTVAAERSVGPLPPSPSTAQDTFRFRSRIGTVTIDPTPDAPEPGEDPLTFGVSAPTGEPLLTAIITEADLVLARQRWTRAVASLTLVTLTFVLLLTTGSLLDWRNRARDTAKRVLATVATAVAIIAARGVLYLSSPADWIDADVFFLRLGVRLAADSIDGFTVRLSGYGRVRWQSGCADALRRRSCADIVSREQTRSR
jgi:hypothetical protein